MARVSTTAGVLAKLLYICYCDETVEFSTMHSITVTLVIISVCVCVFIDECVHTCVLVHFETSHEGAYATKF